MGAQQKIRTVLLVANNGKGEFGSPCDFLRTAEIRKTERAGSAEATENAGVQGCRGADAEISRTASQPALETLLNDAKP